MNPKAVRLAAQKAEQERIKAEAIAAGKKPPADPPSTANITPLVEFRELEVDLKALPDWRATTGLQFPPGRRYWTGGAQNPKVDLECVLSPLLGDRMLLRGLCFVLAFAAAPCSSMSQVLEEVVQAGRFVSARPTSHVNRQEVSYTHYPQSYASGSRSLSHAEALGVVERLAKQVLELLLSGVLRQHQVVEARVTFGQTGRES